MSKVKITGHASGSGTITLTGPNTSSDRTITLPDATGTALMTDGSGASLTALNGTQVTSGTVPTARMPTGSVLQVVYATCHTEISTDSSSYVTTPLTASITPSATSSKILIHYSGSFYHYSNVQVSSTIYRGSSDIAAISSNHGILRSWMESTRGFFAHQGQLLDSPSTTSSTTYTVYVKKNSGSYTIDFPTSSANTFPSITLMEIAG